MIRMVKVYEANGTEVGYMAEVPGQPGRYVKAGSLPELKTELRAALANPETWGFDTPPRPVGQRPGYSDTALFVSL